MADLKKIGELLVLLGGIIGLIQGILLIHNPSGLPIFSRNYSDLMEGNKTLFSGFLQAISIVGEEVIRKDYIKSKGIPRTTARPLPVRPLPRFPR